MATSTPETPATPSCPTKDPIPYERIIIDLEKRPDLKKEIEDATELLDYVMCRVPDPEDAKYKDDEVGFYHKIFLNPGALTLVKEGLFACFDNQKV